MKKIIGQSKLMHDIDSLDSFPRFSIIAGPSGSGKSLIAEHIAEKLNAYKYIIEPKIDNIRVMIHDAYKISEPIVYIIDDADKLSVPAKNSLLKVIEEPPRNAYFIMLLEDAHSTLETIRSRARVFNVDIYSYNELLDYCAENNIELTEQEKSIINQVCSSPGDVDKLVKMNIMDFYGYVGKVYDNIAEVSGANAFKIADKVALKDEEDKYDLRLFWRAFIEMSINGSQYNVGMVTLHYLNDLQIKGINRQALFDMWILGVRREWK